MVEPIVNIFYALCCLVVLCMVIGALLIAIMRPR
jgi:hypothetical protein